MILIKYFQAGKNTQSKWI